MRKHRPWQTLPEIIEMEENGVFWLLAAIVVIVMFIGERIYRKIADKMDQHDEQQRREKLDRAPKSLAEQLGTAGTGWKCLKCGTVNPAAEQYCRSCNEKMN